MTTARQGTIGGRGLGSDLRSLRNSKRLSLRHVATQLEWQPSKLSRIETGKQGITTEDVASLLVIYGVTGEERDRLLAKTERADEPNLWELQGPLSAESRTLIQLEPQATGIFNFEPLLVPGLLQTPDYTRALMKAGGVSEEDTEVRVAARMSRQAILSRDKPPAFEVIIDEGVLRRVVGTPKMMARQLRHLAEATERSNVTLLVLPLSLGAHTGLDGAFAMLDFAKDKPVVYLDHKISGLFLEQPEQVSFFRTEVDRLKSVARSSQESVDTVAAAAKELDHD
ncbi:transcriptional regulator with XRE-family HTH domain [Spinactinospora alkalitolerans]|uniref:Transcriptional regulator with XRE-family HTH domain n=1 Tax=Spinactinospora alkalitolerans TaxID=687207 RepID=A0A852U4G0_9ACTN|nr:helix-turn-helix transcriptional regulator [Spinactinospora alkalitolerans]NYE50382.1 transcriptional regulator with XRE-family HTH domain [Spinactinospora alkalitolerans]